MSETQAEYAIARREDDDRLTPVKVGEVQEQVALIQELMKSVMRVDEHYGVIPGTKKPSLLKPGAEKLCFTFRLVPDFEITNDALPGGHLNVRVLCRLRSIRTGKEWGQGVGSCSTLETKYRYRDAQRKCPSCGTETIRKSKEEKGGGWYCWAKIGGCGKQFKAGDQSVEGQSVGRAENPDIADTYNTVLKMAKKRAHVDATIQALAASDIFTQDVEDAPTPPPPESGGGAPSQGEPSAGDSPPAAHYPPPDTPPVDVCKEWVDEFDVCTDIAKANALWKTVQKVWGTFAGEEQVRITMAKDRCKVRLTQRVEQGSLV